MLEKDFSCEHHEKQHYKEGCVVWPGVCTAVVHHNSTAVRFYHISSVLQEFKHNQSPPHPLTHPHIHRT
jgi:peptide deformylase